MGTTVVKKINIKFMSDEAIAFLKQNTDAITMKLIENPENSEWLHEFLSGDVYIEKPYRIEDFELQIPKDDKDRVTDLQNSILLYERLKGLPKAVLSDERFWNWLNFEKCYKVALKNIPITEGSKVFEQHWLFEKSKRRGLFFGTLSRCYFRVAFTVDDTKEDKYELTKFVVEKPTRFRGITWRTYSGLDYLVRAVIRAEKRIVEDYKINDKPYYLDEIPKIVSRLGSVKLLDEMSEKEIEEYVYNKYRRLVESDIGQFAEALS